MKIMISQPMRGKTEEQIKAERVELVKRLTEEGHEVIDTFSAEFITKDRPEDCDICLWALAKSIKAMSEVDAVVFIQGWKNARGCRIEEQCAREYGKFVMYV